MSKHYLENAKSCNTFFQTNKFQDALFTIKIPLEFANLVDKDNPNDPLLKQVLPPKQKLGGENFVLLPLEDEKYTKVKGVIHKYPNRVLLIASGICTIHCRYCFRQNFDYSKHNIFSNWQNINKYISSDKKISEVVLSGGDPLSLSDNKLNLLISKIEVIKHIKTIRIHSRTLVVKPSRITNKLVNMLNKTKLNVVIVTHINHSQEISSEFKNRIKKLNKITLLNQSVLLKNINDCEKILAKLSIDLFALGIMPYYLHLLDKVSGSEGFLVDDKRAKKIHKKLQKNLSGYLVPRLVRDENLLSKTWI